MAISHNHSRPSRFAEFRFYGELNDFLPAEQKQVGFHSAFYGKPSVKDTIQAMGVPHTAIDLILVDGRPVGFSHCLRGGERVAVYPVFERLDISPLAHLRPQALRCTRFILDVHLGKLARYLRMLGFDTAYQPHCDDVTIIDLSLQQQRIILTRDLGILKQNRVTHGYWLRHTEPWEQLLEVMLALDLFSQAQPFTRCMECNGPIDHVDKTAITGRIDADILQRFEAFWQCRGCMKIYWRGSHYEHMLRQVEKFKEESRRRPT